MLASLRLAFRSLIRSPGFTFLAVITLGLGIGANTAMFSIVNSILLKPLPYPQSERLQRLDRVTPQNPQGRVSAADFLDLQREMQAYGEIGAYALGDTSLSEPGQPAEMVRALRVTANLLPVLRVQPQLGRNFLPREDVPGNDHVVILSQRCWQQRFGSAHDIIGRSVRVDGQPHEVVGVLPAWFNDWRHFGPYDFFRPLALDQQKSSDRRTATLRLLARRHDGMTEADATGFIANFGARLAKDFPEVNAGTSWNAIALNGTAMPKNARALLAILIGLSAFVLLIACSNLANLLLARTMARAREFAVRGALGASRFQLLRPLVNESILLAVAGGICSVVVARWSADWLALRIAAEDGERFRFVFDWRVFGWAFVASVVTAVAFGLAPALFALRLKVNETLKSGARGMTGGRGHRRFRHALIVGQFALAMTLLAGATMYTRAFNELNNTRGGWDSSRVVTGTVVLPGATYGDPERTNTFHRLTLERLQALPGVASVSISSFSPFFNWSDVRKYIVEGRDLPQPGQEPAAVVNSITAAYFDTYQTRILSGRSFNDRDTLASTRVFIISQTTATALFGNENPIGRRLAQTGTGNPQWGEIVGIAANVKSILPDPGPVSLQVYQPMSQDPRPYNEIAVRTTGAAPSSLIVPIRNVMTQLDPDLPIRQLQAADAAIERANTQTAILRDMLTAFAVLGVGLASLGIYGVIARTMAQRTGEFAIRFALGASIRDITAIVLTSGVKLAAIGLTIGLLGALGLARLLSTINRSMHFDNPVAFAVPALLLVAVALIASWLPARRAARINPIEALRAE
ncbi:MAG TPA: ABC transporter permease [Chthoniobacterales bacterium]|jgi:predicted permease|nr:ABC transporter permease [Chthoniobacterales bacterium]